MEKVNELIQEYLDYKIVPMDESGYSSYYNSKKKEYSSGNDGFGPYTYEEAIAYKSNADTKFKYIPEKLFNKKFTIGEFEFIIQHKKVFDDAKEYNSGDFCSLGTKRESYNWTTLCNVIIGYHGFYEFMGQYRDYYSMILENCLPKQTNWHWLKFTKDKPYVFKEDNFQTEYKNYKKIEEIFKSIDFDNVELSDDTFEFQEWYDWKIKKNLDFYSQELDLEYFIQKETKDNIYKPEPNTISRVINRLKKKYDALITLDIKQVQFRSNAHFQLTTHFNLPKNLSIKGPKKVIETYRYEKYCADDSIVKELIKEKKAQKVKQELEVYNNQFTLVQHGKTLLTNVDRQFLINYLESYQAEDLDKKLLENIKPIFDNYDIPYIYLGTWGQYYEYEIKGEKCDFNTDTYSLNKHIDKETLDNIYELYSDNLEVGLSDNDIERAYGWPTLEINVLGVKKGKTGKLSTFIKNDYEIK